MKPEAGRQYRHWKRGDLYTVIAVGRYVGQHEGCCIDHERAGTSTDATGFPEGTELVVYVGHYDNRHIGNHIMIRPVSEWFEVVERARVQAVFADGGRPFTTDGRRYELVT